MEYRIGAGGWAYFEVPEEASLGAYARAFNYVEVNSTYYETPPMATVVGWRRAVPPDFAFTLRAHRSLGEGGFRPSEANHRVLGRALAMARALRAEAIHLLWPRGLPATPEAVEGLRALLEPLPAGGPGIALEVREPPEGPPPGNLLRAMEDLGVLHVVDLSRERPALDRPVLYTRLFGRGEGNRYQFTDEELRELDRAARETAAEKALFTFHGVRMYKDAGRFAAFQRTGRFPRVTAATGPRALREVLREDARFPATREELLRDQGWKVIDWEEGLRLHAAEVLRRLPPGTYTGVEAVLRALPLEPAGA